MKRRIKYIIVAFLAFLSLSNASEEGRGLRMFDQSLKKACGLNAFMVAKKYTQEEWKIFYTNGTLDAQLYTLCPEAKPIKPHYQVDVYAFLYSAAKDSGKIVGGC